MGMNAMFGLKAARDSMNQRQDGPRLYLVMTGSHRGKLAELVVGSKSPFYGGAVQEFPFLGNDFVQALVQQINASRNDVQFDTDDGVKSFEILMHRPEAFLQALREETFDVTLTGAQPNLVARAEAIRERLWSDLDAQLDALTAVQRALFEALIEEGDGFSPFAAASLAEVARRAGVESLSKGAAQTAMKVLVEEELVWQPGSGRYAVDNLDMVDIHKHRKSSPQ